MSSIGAEKLLEEHGSPIGVARALLEGRLNGSDQRYASEVVGKTMLEAARIQIELERATKKKVKEKPVEKVNDGWEPYQHETCDLCSKPPVWRHPAGGLRCGKCQRPA